MQKVKKPETLFANIKDDLERTCLLIQQLR